MSFGKMLPLKDAMKAQEHLTGLVTMFEAAGLSDVSDAFIRTAESAEILTRLTWFDMVDAVRNPRPMNPPTIGKVAGGLPLFYRGEINMIFGTDSVGKSLVMNRITLQELEAGNGVVWLDYEEQDGHRLSRRFVEMGAAPETFVNFKAVFPGRKLSSRDIDVLVNMCDGASLFVLDSVGEYLAAHGANENFDNEVSQWLYANLCREILSRCEDPPAIVFIDHQSKSSDGMTSAGSKRKRAGISGAAYNVHVEDGEGWSRNHDGFAVIKCVKDRDGYRDRGDIAAFVHVKPADPVQGPLSVGISVDEPLMYGLRGGEDMEAQIGGSSGVAKLAAIRELINDAGSKVSAAYAKDKLAEQGIVISKQTARNLIEQVLDERTQAMMATHDVPDHYGKS